MFILETSGVSGDFSTLTSVSASRNTHLRYWVRVQQWSLVKVTPSSGRPSQDRCAWSPLSSTSTTRTWSNTWPRAALWGENTGFTTTTVRFYLTSIHKKYTRSAANPGLQKTPSSESNSPLTDERQNTSFVRSFFSGTSVTEYNFHSHSNRSCITLLDSVILYFCPRCRDFSHRAWLETLVETITTVWRVVLCRG